MKSVYFPVSWLASWSETISEAPAHSLSEINALVSGASSKCSSTLAAVSRGRAGIALTNVLFYGTLGIAYGGGKIELAGLSETNTHFGWAAGAGLEVGLTPNWSAKAEYLYVDLAAKTYLLTGASHSFESNILRFGLNYRF